MTVGAKRALSLPEQIQALNLNPKPQTPNRRHLLQYHYRFLVAPTHLGGACVGGCVRVCVFAFYVGHTLTHDLSPCSLSPALHCSERGRLSPSLSTSLSLPFPKGLLTGASSHQLFSHELFSHQLFSHELFSHQLFSHQLFSQLTPPPPPTSAFPPTPFPTHELPRFS